MYTYVLAEFLSTNFFAHQFWLSVHSDLLRALLCFQDPTQDPLSDPALLPTDPRGTLRKPDTVPYTSPCVLSEIGLS